MSNRRVFNTAIFVQDIKKGYHVCMQEEEATLHFYVTLLSLIVFRRGNGRIQAEEKLRKIWNGKDHSRTQKSQGVVHEKL